MKLIGYLFIVHKIMKFNIKLNKIDKIRMF